MGTSNRHSGPSDEELIKAYKSTLDQNYLGQLYLRHEHQILANAVKVLKRTPEAEEVPHEIFVELRTKLLEYEVKNFRSWLFKIVHNHCLQILRKRKGITEVDVDSEKFENLFMEMPAFEHLDNEDESMLQRLHEAIAQLKDAQKICLVHFYLEELSYKEIASRTGFDMGQVKSNIQNGKRNLYLILSKTT
jgi:RNA polymerase sigma-70 factor (ECF subfamily)